MNQLKKYRHWLIVIVVTIIISISNRGFVLAQPVSHYTDLQYPPLPEIQLPEYERYTLSNGMVVYLMEDHQLPLVTGRALIRTSSTVEPDNLRGLANITGNLMRTGGTKNYTKSEIDGILELKSASVESAIGLNSGSVSFDSLSFDLPIVFDLFTEVLRYPVFNEDFLDFEKSQVKGAISRRNDNPGNIASREFRQLVYGENSPYARNVEYATVDNISRDDVINFYGRDVRPSNIILGIVGDFQPQQIKQLIESKFADWQVNSTPALTSVATPTQATDGGIYLVDQPQSTQSNILLGHLGGKLSDANYPTLTVINGILNGFGGRLHNEVRSKQGLAYSVYGVWSANYDYPGIFIAGGQTKTESSGDFIKAINTEIERLRTEKITPADLDYAQNSILNSFVFQFQTLSQTLSRLLTYEYYDYPQDFIFDYQKQVKTTTIENVYQVAQRYLMPEKMVTLIVGNAEVVKPSLESFNQEINLIDVSIPNNG
ncbi:MAG: insulinase family protein [Cyanobacterium sp. T60_A2020_053]|nr:insulinase family protein [Cyanobacterium sp. T60_A2020_053]